MRKLVALDSNALSYLIDAHKPDFDPAEAGPIGPECLALVRMRFYCEDLLLWIGPTVRSEYQNIIDEGRLELHRIFAEQILEDFVPWFDEDHLEFRARKLGTLHSGQGDCRVLAEAELAPADALLTCDARLIRALGQTAVIPVLRPSEYWEGVQLPAQATPVWRPSPGHPLFGRTWWHMGDA